MSAISIMAHKRKRTSKASLQIPQEGNRQAPTVDSDLEARLHDEKDLCVIDLCSDDDEVVELTHAEYQRNIAAHLKQPSQFTKVRAAKKLRLESNGFADIYQIRADSAQTDM